ncbi:hypothetical protein A3K93_03645 [Acinetobacter sp. NCu2D-2]|uniref:YadA C-terminal domain-containing protein n=1 Tax=Acinetobacter sp. NCu2D-2 TaxID=1608473 RepID=UPI0007CDCF70|nr:YadA C-terminal domain-containing protein [Acinetobacter sp. NCu2D-2]ANF81374.1 hypothetical protein A3K93_03645 [Acinetobacter sp. NCu2D-2]
MSLHLKKTSIALAVAAVTGTTFAAPTATYQPAVDAELGTNYQQTTGTTETTTPSTGTTVTVSKEDIATGDLVSATTPAINGPEVQIGGINYRNYSYQEIRKGLLEARNDKESNTTAADGTNTVSESWDTTTATGQAKRTANTRIQLDKTINPATEIAGTKERLDDSSFDFTNDDVNTVIDARTTSDKGSSEEIVYAAADERINSSKFQNTTSDLTTKAKLGTDGKPIAGQTIRVGTVENKFTENNVYYKSTTDANGVTTSKNASGLLSSEEWSSAVHDVSENYQVNPTNNVVAFNLSADKKTLLESTVNTNKSAFSSKDVDYDDVNAAGLASTEETKWSYDNSQESLLDGFVSVDKGSNETSETQYNQAALGTKNALDYIETSKSSTETKTRDFVKNADGEIVLTAGKPTVNTETETKTTNETYDSVYQPTRYTADDADKGITKGDAYKDHIENSAENWWYQDTNVQKSTNKGTSSTVVTHKQDADFKEHWNTSWDNSAVYARNHQENIEVDRDISNSWAEDNKYLAKIEGVSVVKQAEEANFQIGTVAVDVNGNKFDSSDVHTWKDETGKERYYVLLDNDANGNQVRSEVTFKDGKPLETKAAEIQTVKTEVYSEKRTDKVTMGAEVAYQTNEKETWDEKTTSKDGATVYAADKGSDETNVKVFSVGKNALHRESVTTESSESVETQFDQLNGDILFADGKPVVLSVESTKTASNEIDRLFQEGQDKTRENISTSSFEGNVKNAAGVVQTTYKGHDNWTDVDYAAGKELANTFVQDQAFEVTAKAVTNNVGFNYDGTAKANIDSNTLRDSGTVDAGLAVKNAQAGEIVVDTKLDTSNKEDTKTYQDGGVKALESTQVQTNVQTVTYADATTGTVKDNQASTVTLFNKGKADKYREAVNTTDSETTAKTYKTDADGDIVLVDGKPVESGTNSYKQTVTTSENLYQIGQERKADTVVVTDTSEKTANVDGSGRDFTAKATTENVEYRSGQKDGKETELNTTNASELKVTKADNTGYTYKEDRKTSNVTNETEMHLLANREVKSVGKTEWTESLAASGKNAVSITRGTEFVNRTDESSTDTIYGSETVTAATGTTTVAKKEVDVIDKFGTFESSTLSRTETKVAADKSATSNTATRVDSVNGVVLNATQTNTDVAGKTVTSTRTTSLNATTGLTTDQITLNGKDLQTELNRMGNNIDKVQKTAYRGIAIALAAQQAVPNIAPGQVAVFGGVGHYEGETAGSIGVVTSFTDRISASGAFGFASGNEFGGRVGVAYVFGGK